MGGLYVSFPPSAVLSVRHDRSLFLRTLEVYHAPPPYYQPPLPLPLSPLLFLPFFRLPPPLPRSTDGWRD